MEQIAAARQPFRTTRLYKIVLLVFEFTVFKNMKPWWWWGCKYHVIKDKFWCGLKMENISAVFKC